MSRSLRIVSALPEPNRERRRQLRVDDETHSRRLLGGHDDGAPKLRDCVRQTRANVVALQIREVRQNLVFARPVRKHLENVDDADSHTPNARSAVALFRAHGDA